MRRKFSFIMNVFCMINTSVLVTFALFITVIYPTETVSTEILWQIPAVSMLTALLTLLYPWDRAMGKIELVIRVFIHYVLNCAVVLYAGWKFYWYDIRRVGSVVSMVFSITLIFAVVSAVVWLQAIREAKKMNMKLVEYRNRKVYDMDAVNNSVEDATKE